MAAGGFHFNYHERNRIVTWEDDHDEDEWQPGDDPDAWKEETVEGLRDKVGLQEAKILAIVGMVDSLNRMCEEFAADVEFMKKQLEQLSEVSLEQHQLLKLQTETIQAMSKYMLGEK